MTAEHRQIMKEIEHYTAEFVKAAKAGDTRSMDRFLFELRELQQHMMCIEMMTAYPDAFSDDQPGLFDEDHPASNNGGA